VVAAARVGGVVTEPTIEELRAENRRLHEWRRAVLGFLVDQERDRDRRRTLIAAGQEFSEFGFHDRPTSRDICVPDDDEPSIGDVVFVESNDGG
jgi:hypothetical protein